MMVSGPFVKVSAAAAGSTTDECSGTAADQTSNQRASAGTTDDGGIAFPPVLALVPGRDWLII
jgi:hypothetical protein